MSKKTTSEDKPRKLNLKNLKDDTVASLLRIRYRIGSLELRLQLMENCLAELIEPDKDDTYH